MSSSVTWEDEDPCEALGVVREELPILYTNSFIRRRAELLQANILYIGVDVAETVGSRRSSRRSYAPFVLGNCFLDLSRRLWTTTMIITYQ